MTKIILIFLLFFKLGFTQTNSVFDIARQGTLTEIELLYKSSPSSIDATNDKGYSPLILACYRGNIPVAEFLIDKSKNLNYVADMGTALMACIVKGQTALAEKLIKRKIDVNITDSQGITALMYAVQFKNKKIVSLLLQNGANKTIKDKNGKTAFEYAVFSGEDEIINLLK